MDEEVQVNNHAIQSEGLTDQELARVSGGAPVANEPPDPSKLRNLGLGAPPDPIKVRDPGLIAPPEPIRAG